MTHPSARVVPISDALRLAREGADLSIRAASIAARQLATDLRLTVLGLAPASIGEYERGASAPSAETVRVLARVYGVDVSAVVPDLPDMESPDA